MAASFAVLVGCLGIIWAIGIGVRAFHEVAR